MKSIITYKEHDLETSCSISPEYFSAMNVEPSSSMMAPKLLRRRRTVVGLALALIGAFLVCFTVIPTTRSKQSRQSPADVEVEGAGYEKRSLFPLSNLKFGKGGSKERAEEPDDNGEGMVQYKPPTWKKRPRRAAKTKHKVLTTVNLTASDGFLWHPTSISSAKCTGGADSGTEVECEGRVTFCHINIASYQETPWAYPMAPMLHKGSECSQANNSRTYALPTLWAYVNEHPDKFLQPTGFIFHETRTGSTLVANMLGHVPTNLMMSEHNMAEEPNRGCYKCTREQKVTLAKELLTLLGTAEAGHTHSFFKFQDATSIDILSEAFPDVPWVFLFRDPVEVMVSNLKGAYGKRKRLYNGFDFDAANATDPSLEKPKRSSRVFMAPCLMNGMFRTSHEKTEAFSKETVCARRLKDLCNAAITGMSAQHERVGNGDSGSISGKGAVVEYTNLPKVVTDYLYADHFGMGKELLEAHMPYLSVAAGMYSKSMSNPESKFNVGMDAGYKHVMAESAYRDAADATGLTDTYHKLQAMQTWKGKV